MANRIETSLLVKGLTADTYALDVRGKTFVDGDIEINGNVNIVGTATTINTQTVQARDNKIELNYSGSTSTAIGGGIEILSGRTDGSSVSLTIDTDRDWNSNTGLNISGRTSDATTNGLKVVNSLGTDNFVVRNDGNVGIGTSTPSAKLHLYGTTPFISENTTDGTSTGLIIRSSDSVFDNGQELRLDFQQQTSSIGKIASTFFGGQEFGFKFYGLNNSGFLNDLITFRGSGNVGIGTSTPTEKLEVSGNLKVNGNLTATGDTSLQSFTGTSGNVTTNLLVPTIYGSTSSGGTLTLRSTTNTNKGFVSFPEAGSDGVKIGGLVGATTTSAIYLNVASPSNTNYSILDTGGTLKLNSNQTDLTTDMFQVLRLGGLGSAKMTMSPYGVYFNFDAVTFSNPKTFEIRVPANTGQNSGTNINNFYVQGNTKQWNTGAITNQYWNYFSQNTASFVGSSTITNSYGLFVDEAVAGTNATITNNYALGLNGSLSMSDGSNINVGTSTGTTIGRTTSQKLGFYGTTPKVQPSAVTTLQGLVDALGSTSGLGLIAPSTLSSYTTLFFGHDSATFASASTQTYCFGNQVNLAPTVLASQNDGKRVVTPVTGTITDVTLSITLSVNGSSEPQTLTIANVTSGTTSTVSSSVRYTGDSTNLYTLVSPLSVTKGDKLELRTTTSGFTTTPTSIRQSCEVVIKL